MTGWSPEAWGDFSVVGIVVAAGTAHMIAYIRGWLIPGRHHKEIVDSKDATISRLEEGRVKDAETIQIQAATISQRDNVEQTVTKMLKSFRESVSGQ